jgi:sodium/hydrogen antiporter
MHDHAAAAFIASLLLGFGLMSRRVETLPVTGPMVFVLAGVLLGPAGFDVFESRATGELVRGVATVTLLLILFVDASLLRMKDVLRESPRLALRLLGVGLPLCIAAGFGVGVLLYGTTHLWPLALLALILAPTDAALGQAVIKSPAVPSSIRRAVSVESGLNDGIALPFIMVCIAALGTAERGWFGPRGIASVLYLLIVVGSLGYAGLERLVSVVVLTVLLSVFLHGLSAVPGTRWLARGAA